MAFSISDVLAIIQNGVTAVNNLNIQVRGSLNAILSRFVTNEANIATNTASIAAHEAVWTAYTPTLTALAGAYTTAAASGRYHTIGKTVFIFVEIFITTIGTGTYPLFTLPVSPLNFATVIFSGNEVALTGKTVGVRYTGVGSTMLVVFYDNSIPAANGNIIRISGVYEAA